ncbi:unnamed protein product [Urochloa decumbens]|uniref:DNA2/NAM7 helicase-like C-terminal domain-containing protein n=1 Tax=Urochloa decumbens TaxID=240449 RepID=A0ABC9BCL8_9POAL
MAMCKKGAVVKPEARAAAPNVTPTLQPQSSFLSMAVLSWTIRDVLDDSLYKNKVRKIPPTYDSVEQFVEVQSVLLLEETRSTICSAIRSHSEIQYCQLHSARQCGASSLYFLDIDLPKTRSDTAHCHHIFEDLDVCLLSSAPIGDSTLDIQSCSLAIATGVGRDINFQRSFRVLMSNHGDFQSESIKFVSFLTNIRIKMETSIILSDHDEKSHDAVKAILELYEAVGKKCTTCAGLDHFKDGVHSTNQIKSVISSLRCSHQYNSQLVWAPPGSLKGYMCTIMKDLLHLNPKVLICLPTKASVPEFVMDIEEIFGSCDALSDVIVLNSVRGMEKCGKVQKVFLENQSQELFCCLTQTIGWMKAMYGLLGLSSFSHTRCKVVETCEECNNSGLISFSTRLFTERFHVFLDHIRDAVTYLINHPSAIPLPEKNSGNLEELLHLMDQFASLLDEDLTDDCVAAAFGLTSATDVIASDSTYSIANSLNEKRIGCITLMGELIKSLKLPQLKDRNGIDKFCIENSRIIITTLVDTIKLHGLNMDTFDILIISGAGQIKECDLLVPLLLPMRHIVVLGDHLHLQPSVHSKICKEAGYDVSIYERLQKLSSEKHMLTHQYVMHPLICKFINDQFYNGKLQNGPNVQSVEYNKVFESQDFPVYSFMDIPSMELVHSENGNINSAVIYGILKQMCSGLNNTSKRLKVGVLCLSNNEAIDVNQLSNKRKIHNKVNLEVKFIDRLEGDLFDVIIVSTIVKDNVKLNNVKRNSLNIAHTSARHCCCMVGESDALIESGGIWKELLDDARSRQLIKPINANKLVADERFRNEYWKSLQ